LEGKSSWLLLRQHLALGDPGRSLWIFCFAKMIRIYYQSLPEVQSTSIKHNKNYIEISRPPNDHYQPPSERAAVAAPLLEPV
jgi:hypothetical protein